MEKEIPLFREFKQFLRLEIGISENSQLAYISDIESLRAYFDGDIINITPETVVSFMAKMRKDGLSLETIVRRLSGISQYYDFLIVEKKITQNPIEFVAKPKMWHKLPSFLDFDEVDRLISSQDIRGRSDEVNIRNNIIIEMLYATGMRVSELTNLKIRDIDFKKGIIKVFGKGSKERIVPAYDSLLMKVEDYLEIRNSFFLPKLKANEKDEGYLFLNQHGKKLSRQQVWLMVQERCIACNITKHVSPHTLRHSFATHMLSNGADLRALQLFLGHANISTTEIYTHVTDDDKRRTIMKFHPLFRKD